MRKRESERRVRRGNLGGDVSSHKRKQVYVGWQEWWQGQTIDQEHLPSHYVGGLAR